MCSPSWTLLPPPSPFHPSGLSQCTSPKHPVSCIEPGLATHLIHDILHVSMPFSQIFPPSPSPTESIRLFYLFSYLRIYHFSFMSPCKVLIFSSNQSHAVFIRLILRHLKFLLPSWMNFFSVVFSKLLFTIKQLIYSLGSMGFYWTP